MRLRGEDGQAVPLAAALVGMAVVLVLGARPRSPATSWMLPAPDPPPTPRRWPAWRVVGRRRRRCAVGTKRR